MSRRIIAAIAAGALAASLSGCGGDVAPDSAASASVTSEVPGEDSDSTMPDSEAEAEVALDVGESEPPAGMDSMWIARIEQIRETALRVESQFVLDIVADWEITAAEVQEVWMRANECVVEEGALPLFRTREEIAASWAGSEHLIPAGHDIFERWWDAQIAWSCEDWCGDNARSNEMSDAVWQCAAFWNGGYFGIVDAFYVRAEASLSPPTPDEIIACLVRRDLVSDDFTTQDLAGVESELAWPTTCEEIRHDPRFVNVQCHTEDEQAAGSGQFSADSNPDWVFESRVYPGAPNLNDPEVSSCL